jgi:hypothetical protein
MASTETMAYFGLPFVRRSALLLVWGLVGCSGADLDFSEFQQLVCDDSAPCPGGFVCQSSQCIAGDLADQAPVLAGGEGEGEPVVVAGEGEGEREGEDEVEAPVIVATTVELTLTPAATRAGRPTPTAWSRAPTGRSWPTLRRRSPSSRPMA